MACCTAVCYGAVLVPAVAELSPPLRSRQIVATGDELRGFGRVGVPSVLLNGIDGRGRVLFGAQLSNGRLGLFLGDGSGIETVWESSEDGPRLQIDSGKISESGRILVPAFAHDVLYSLPTDLFEVRKNGLRRLIGPGDLTEDGDVICQIGSFEMNESGTVAIHTISAPSRGSCEAFDAEFEAIYLIAGGLPRRVLKVDYPESLALIGLTEEGFAVVARRSEQSLIIATDGLSTSRLAEFDLSLISASANAAEQVAFLAYDDDGVQRRLYLVDDGAVREISALDTTPAGHSIAWVDDPEIDGAGNVVVAVWSWTSDDVDGSGEYGVIHYSPEGEATWLGSQLSEPRVNHAGQIAAMRSAPMKAPEIVRWTDQEEALIVDGSRRAPGDGWYAFGGLGGGCMSEDGLVGFVASSTDSGETLLCADESGPHLLGVDELQARRLHFFSNCRFSQERLLFTAIEGSLTGGDYFEANLGVYRADANGITRLIGPGDAIIDGESLIRLRAAGSGYFAANGAGSVVVAALTDVGEMLLLLREGRMLEPLPIATTDLEIGMLVGLGIAADDTVIAIVDPPGDETVWEDDDDAGWGEVAAPTTLVALDGAGSRVLARTGDPTVSGGPYRSFDDLWVRGHVAWFTALDSSGVRHVLQYDLIESTMGEVEMPGLDEDYFTILSISPGGRILYETGSFQPEARATRRMVNADGVVELLSDGSEAHDPEPVAFNDRGNVLLSTRRSPLGAQRVTLSLAGPEVTAMCPTSAATTTHDDDGCQLVASPSSSICWPVLLVAFLIPAGRILFRVAR